jgi:preprotein translocase subunit SecG
MMTILLLLLHITVCLVLILVVLLQTGKRADLAGAFGGGGSQTAFGARGAATFLSKATTWSAGIFMVTSLVLGVRFGRETAESVVQEPPANSVPAPLPAPPPVQPAPQPASPAPANSGVPANPSPTPGAPGGK